MDSVIYNCVMGGSGFGCVRLSFVFGDKQLMMASTIHKQKEKKVDVIIRICVVEI